MSSKDDIRRKRKLEKLAAKEAVKCMNNFYYFFKTFWPEMSGEVYQDAWHIKLICDVLEDRAMKLIRLEQIMETIVINVPPRSSKSTIVTIAFPLWIWLHKPNFTTTNISYSATLSKKHAYISRGITDSKKWHALFDNIFEKVHGKPLEILKQNELEMLNNFKGSRFNTSVGGTITGMHANIVIEDDPLNPEEAHSDAERENAIRFHDETISTRLKNFTSYLNIIIAQRLHEEDTCGHVLNQDLPITHICLPGELTSSCIVKPEEYRDKYEDNILDPLGKPREVLDQLKIKLKGAYSGQVLQMPFNMEDQDITPGMFKIIHPKELADDIIWDVWIDGAYTDKTENDPSGIMIAAKVGHNLIIKENYNLWKKLPDLVSFLIELEEGGSFDGDKGRIFIEPKASGYSLAQYIENDTDYNFVLIGEHNKREGKLVSQGKVARHNLIKPKAESGRITLVEGSWHGDFFSQVCGFPKAAADEAVDTLGYAVNHYYFAENTFIAQHAIERLSQLATDSIGIKITSQISGFNISADYEENDSGDVQLFEEPTYLHRYRYTCVLVLRGEGERAGNTCILIYDRLEQKVVAMLESEEIDVNKAGRRAMEMGIIYGGAKLVVAIRKEIGRTVTEEYDLSHIVIKEARRLRYPSIFSRLTTTDIKQTRERQYGFLVDQSTSREVYYNLKEKAEKGKIKEIPGVLVEEMKLLERKKETGEILPKEGYQVNSLLAYAIALKTDVEIYDKPVIKRKDKWNK